MRPVFAIGIAISKPSKYSSGARTFTFPFPLMVLHEIVAENKNNENVAE
jgi:hypothetical protein